VAGDDGVGCQLPVHDELPETQGEPPVNHRIAHQKPRALPWALARPPFQGLVGGRRIGSPGGAQAESPGQRPGDPGPLLLPKQPRPGGCGNLHRYFPEKPRALPWALAKAPFQGLVWGRRIGSPGGAQAESPGQRPGDLALSSPSNHALGYVATSTDIFPRNPGRCPGLWLGRPFRAWWGGGGSGAPEGRKLKAQGNALGTRPPPPQAATLWGMWQPPPIFSRETQGVALGSG
jgi:hypothetical protein